jgi:hypothetical protein
LLTAQPGNSHGVRYWFRLHIHSTRVPPQGIARIIDEMS